MFKLSVPCDAPCRQEHRLTGEDIEAFGWDDCKQTHYWFLYQCPSCGYWISRTLPYETLQALRSQSNWQLRFTVVSRADMNSIISDDLVRLLPLPEARRAKLKVWLKDDVKFQKAIDQIIADLFKPL